MSNRTPSIAQQIIGGSILLVLGLCGLYTTVWALSFVKEMDMSVFFAYLPPSLIVGTASGLYISRYFWVKFANPKDMSNVVLAVCSFPFTSVPIGYVTLICLAKLFN
jgi:hypothetical protein